MRFSAQKVRKDDSFHLVLVWYLWLFTAPGTSRPKFQHRWTLIIILMEGVWEEGQDDERNRLKRPYPHLFLEGFVPKMCPKKVATRGLTLVPVAP